MTIIRDLIDEPRLISDGAFRSRTRFIDFLHPGYVSSNKDAEGDVLISLRAFDANGVDYDIAHAACAIFAANRWDGYFSHSRDGTARVDPSRDGILREQRYYFCLPPLSTSTSSPADPYPVVARFSDWRFPHGQLHPIWARMQDQLETSLERSQATSGWCCLSNYADPVELAHLVPSAQSNWWLTNRMARYSETTLFSTDPINAPANRIPLRSDIHRIFDERHFALTPKLSYEETDDVAPANAGNRPTVQPKIHLVGHVFNSTPSGQLPMLWHNRCVHRLPMEVSVECLFARFAWTIFSPTVFRDFLDAGKSRRILIWNHETGEYDIEDVDSEKCRAIWTASRSRSESPKKKQRTGSAQQQDGEVIALHQSHDTTSDVDSGYHDWASSLERASSASDESERGRTRKRKAGDGCIRSHKACETKRQRRVPGSLQLATRSSGENKPPEKPRNEVE